MGKSERDIQGAATDSTWTVTNRITDRAHDCNLTGAGADSGFGDVLGTLIEDLIAQGVLTGTVAS